MLLVEIWKSLNWRCLGNPASPPDPAAVPTVSLFVTVAVVGVRKRPTRPKLLCWFRLDWTISMKASQPHSQTICVRGCIPCLRNRSMWIDTVTSFTFFNLISPWIQTLCLLVIFFFSTNVNNSASGTDGPLTSSRQTGTDPHFSRWWGQSDPAAFWRAPCQREVWHAATGDTRPGSPERLRPAVTSGGGSQVWSGQSGWVNREPLLIFLQFELWLSVFFLCVWRPDDWI